MNLGIHIVGNEIKVTCVICGGPLTITATSREDKYTRAIAFYCPADKTYFAFQSLIVRGKDPYNGVEATRRENV